MRLEKRGGKEERIIVKGARKGYVSMLGLIYGSAAREATDVADRI